MGVGAEAGKGAGLSRAIFGVTTYLDAVTIASFGEIDGL